jgi:Rod binding domain-containing protein
MTELSASTSSSYLDFNGLTRLKGEAARDPSKAIRQTAEQFEAYFIQQMMKTMRESIEKSDLVEGGNMDMYQDLMDKEISLNVAKRGGMGLANMLERQMNMAQAMSTQDALKLQNPVVHTAPPALPLVPAREAMSLKPAAIQAYELERNNGFKLGDKP